MPAPPSADPSVPGALRQLARQFGGDLDTPTLDRLARFVDLLHTWNARINLTGARTPQAIVAELPDSFALAQLVPQGASLVDVGSGGGLPAIPFALLRPDVRLTLTEPRSRRRAFLSTALRELGLAADVRPDRVEGLPAKGFDCATARAVFPPDDWLSHGQRVVAPGGLVFLFLPDGGWEVPPGTTVARELRYEAGAQGHRLAAVCVPRA